MKKSIVFKIMTFYIILLITTLGITFISFSNLSGSYLLEQNDLIINRDQGLITEFLESYTNNYPKNIEVVFDEAYIRLLNNRISRNLESLSSQFVLINKYKRDIYVSKKRIEISNIFVSKIKPSLSYERTESKYSLLIDNVEYTVKQIPITKKLSTDLRGGWLVIYNPTPNLGTLSTDYTIGLIFIFLFSVLVVLISSIIFSYNISNPILKMKNAAKRISERDFTAKVDIKGKDEIAELGSAINDMSASLYTYDNAQKTFLQNASHELKTPLMSIQGYAEGIKDNIFNDLSQPLYIILEETNRMKRTVDDLLMLSKLETLDDFFVWDDYEMNEIILSAVNKAKGLLLNKKINIEITNNDKALLELDNDKITQALLNIITNAFRYAKTTIQISSTIMNNYIVICISDDGNGICSSDIAHIFERFYKGEKGQSGLGLSISKLIIEKHGGTLSAFNKAHSGAVFEIKLPLYKF